MSNKITIINAQMTCTGCSGSVTKLLKKVEGLFCFVLLIIVFIRIKDIIDNDDINNYYCYC